MPIIEFGPCAGCGTRFEKLYTFSQVNDDMKERCPVCKKRVPRILFSRTLEPMFYGNPDGYHKPSATKRYSTKLVAEGGNNSAVG